MSRKRTPISRGQDVYNVRPRSYDILRARSTVNQPTDKQLYLVACKFALEIIRGGDTGVAGTSFIDNGNNNNYY